MNKRSRKRAIHTIALVAIAASLVLYLIPIYWIVATSLKTNTDIFAMPPKFFFKPTLDNYKGLMRTKTMTRQGEEIVSAAKYPHQLLNSIIVGFVSTALAVGLGTISAYAFSRFEVKGKNDLLFFILSTRMMPSLIFEVGTSTLGACIWAARARRR